MNKLYFVTSNKGKAAEAEAILDIPIEIVHTDLDEIQEMAIEKVVTHKVKQAFDHIKKPVMVDDVAFYVDVWKGFPGPFIKFLQQIDDNKLLLYMLRNEKNRHVKAVATIGFHDGKKVHIFNGEVKGTLTKKPRGNKGWGFDPIFVPEGQNQTFGEMGTEQKNKLSHRYHALQKFKKYLDKST